MPVTSSYTNDFAVSQTGYGWRNLNGVYLPPGGQVAAYVRSTGVQNGDDPYLSTTTGTLQTTLAGALARCRSGLGDTVVVLPGHSESVVDSTMLTGLVAGTHIIGCGNGSLTPTFRWTATGSVWNVSVNDVVIAGLRLRMEGANGVSIGIDITGADFTLANCDIEVASGASNKATNPIKVDTGAARCNIVGNIFRGTATHNCTDGILVAAAVDELRICDNEMAFSCTAASHGLITVNAVAATSMKILRNQFINTMTSSIQTVYLIDAAHSGLIAYNNSSVTNNGTAANQGVVFSATSSTLVKCSQNFTSDEPGKSGVLAPGAVAT